MLMDLMVGGNLKEMLPLDERSIFKVSKQILQGLVYLHEN